MVEVAYTVVITSCRRFDLLRQTIQTLVPHLDFPRRVGSSSRIPMITVSRRL
jgi:hypothetical protein